MLLIFVSLDLCGDFLPCRHLLLVFDANPQAKLRYGFSRASWGAACSASSWAHIVCNFGKCVQIYFATVNPNRGSKCTLGLEGSDRGICWTLALSL